MSTSPSWFDQEKFSRLVKKVGTKAGSEPAASTPPASSPAPTTVASAAPVVDVNPAATANISLVSKPPSLMSEHRALPALPRRTTALPTLKSLFSYPTPAADKPAAEPAAPATPEPSEAEAKAAQLVDESAVKQEEEDEKPGDQLVEPAGDEPIAEEDVEVKETTETPVEVKAEEPVSKEESAIKEEPVAKEETVEKKAEPPPLPVVESPKKEEFKPAIPEPAAKAPASIPVEPPRYDEDDDTHLGEDDDDLAGIWQKMALLNEELAHTVQERDHALGDVNLLREQLKQADAALENGKPGAASEEELKRVTKERDTALAELKALREQAPPPVASGPPPILGKAPETNLTKTKEINFLTQERDQARKEYAELRKQFEVVKRDQTAPKEESSKFRKELEQQLEGFRAKLEERNREIAALKAAAPVSSVPVLGAAPGASPEEVGKLKEEIASLKEQLKKAKEDTSIAQRGLALSQKALQETRDTLREATEGTSLTRHNFDNLKNELTGLQQQNTVLQAQNEQLTRDLAAMKTKRLQM
jgi:hypothetical protein